MSAWTYEYAGRMAGKAGEDEQFLSCPSCSDGVLRWEQSGAFLCCENVKCGGRVDASMTEGPCWGNACDSIPNMHAYLAKHGNERCGQCHEGELVIHICRNGRAVYQCASESCKAMWMVMPGPFALPAPHCIGDTVVETSPHRRDSVVFPPEVEEMAAGLHCVGCGAHMLAKRKQKGPSRSGEGGEGADEPPFFGCSMFGRSGEYKG